MRKSVHILYFSGERAHTITIIMWIPRCIVNLGTCDIFA